jgi:chromosomal replication initiator protein
MTYFNYPGLKDRQNIVLKTGIEPEHIVKVVCNHFELPVDRIFDSNRKREYVYGRHVICYFLLRYTKMNKSRIGEFINRDHTTVINALRVLHDLMYTEDEVREEIEIIRTKILER